MKKLVLEDVKKISIQIGEIPKLDDVNNVLINIKACGICSSDYSRIYEKGAYKYPLILGHEFSGVVKDIYRNIKNIKKGDRVAVFPLKPCFKCDNCHQKLYAQCSSYGYYGSREDGGLQEFLAVPEWNIISIDNIPYDIAALIEPASVALHAIKKVNIENHDKILILGSGIIGILTGLLLREMGINNFYYVVRNHNKNEILRLFNFQSIDYSYKNNDFNIVFECVGSNESLENSIKFLKTKSTLVLVGNPESDMLIKRDVYWKILRMELNIIGIWNSYFPCEWQEVVKIMKLLNYSCLREMIQIVQDFNELLSTIDQKYQKKNLKLKIMWVNNE
ncbi:MULTISPECIES: alcohol dehydrogenase catalytic domain-containing protein [Campylobacter]|nr:MULTISPECIES: alcohol dehydrogenase catalytic domain-containing protein [Campylobacter]